MATKKSTTTRTTAKSKAPAKKATRTATAKTSKATTKAKVASKRTTTKARTSKVSTKVTAVKAVAKQAPKVQKQRFAFLTLNRLWLAAAVLSLLLAVAIPFLVEPVSFMLTQTHLTRDALLSGDDTTFISASKPIWDIELRWLLTGLMALSAVLPILYLTRLKGYYQNRVANRRVVETRWLDLAVTSAIMIEIIALLCGYSDVATLKLMAGSLALTCGLGWLAEKQNENAGRPVWSAFVLSLFAGVLPWLAIGIAHIGTLLFGEVRSPWYVYAACITALTGFTLLALNQWNQHRRFRNWANYEVVERNYVLIAVVTKVAFAGILIVGLLKSF